MTSKLVNPYICCTCQNFCLCYSLRYHSLLVSPACRPFDQGVTGSFCLSNKTWSDSGSIVSSAVLSMLLLYLGVWSKWTVVMEVELTVCSAITHHLINLCSEHDSCCGSFTAYEASICQEFIVCFCLQFNLPYSTEESGSTDLPPASKQVWHLVTICIDTQWSLQLAVLTVWTQSSV